MNAAVTIPSLLLALCSTSQAIAVFSQAPAVNNITLSDSHHLTDGNGGQVADEFTLTENATVNTVTWRGAYTPDHSGTPPTLPLDFNVLFYADDSGLPDETNILSDTVISFASLDQITDTGINVFGSRDVFEFSTTIDGITFEGGTTYWFSVVGHTENDEDDSFWWSRRNDGGVAAHSANGQDTSSTFFSQNNRDYYFVLEGDVIIPEPSAALLLLLGAFPAMRRTRSSRDN